MYIKKHVSSFEESKNREIKEFHEFFESGKLYCLDATIPVYKNKKCFELKTWSWFNHEESLFLDIKNVFSNTRVSYTATNIKSSIVNAPYNSNSPPYLTNIKKPKKIMMFLDFIKNSDNIKGADNKTSMIYHPFPSTIRSLSHAVCLKFLHESQIIYVPINPGQQKFLFYKQEV